MELRDKVGQLPFSPGVYLYKDGGGRVIYVGKAKSLRNRVRSYFSEDKLADVKTGTLIAEARDIDYILVDNEKEALALENNLIKQYQPRFNILLRDDKTFPYIKMTHEKYPRVYVTRRLRKDGEPAGVEQRVRTAFRQGASRPASRPARLRRRRIPVELGLHLPDRPAHQLGK